MNLNKNKIIIGSGLALLFGFVSFIPKALAATPAGCSFSKEAAELSILEKNTEIGFREKSNQKLALKQEILRKIVGCGIDEADALKDKLIKISSDDSEVERLRDRLLLELDQAINYYKINGAVIEELDLLELKALARKFLDWRINNFQYTAGSAINLITWLGNQTFIELASSRFDQVAQAVRFVGADNPDNEIPSLLKKSKSDLDEAKKLNKKAWQALKGYGPPSKALDLIKASLEKLSDMYDGFLKMNEIITGIPSADNPDALPLEENLSE